MQGFVFEEYWLASKAWERHGLTTGAARSLVHNGFLTLDDLQGAHDLELATISRIGRKSLAVLYGLMGGEVPSNDGRRPGRQTGRCMTSRLGSDLPDKEALDWLSRAS